MSEHMSYFVSSGDALQPVQLLRDLGVTVSSDMSWSPHITKITRQARSISSWVFSVFKTRDRTAMLTLYKSLVRSILEYCCPLWNPHTVRDIQQLESVQRTFTSKIAGYQDKNYWQRLKALKLMSLQRRRERYIILQMWKILHHACPNDIGVMFSQPSRLGIKAKVPVLQKGSTQRHQSLYDTSFAVHGPKLWNIIPSELTLQTDFQNFKNSLTEFLSKVPDKPPVTGYTSPNRNSLLEWNMNKQGWSENVMTL